MGNNTQGYILDGQVQGVKQGEGVLINPDGTINFDPTGLNSVVRTNNNDDAYNEYIWPAPFTIEAGTFLSINASSELSWNPPSIGSVVTVGGLQPTPAKVGRLWFDPATYLLKVYENLDGTGKWTPASQGNPVDPGSVSAEPTWVEGDGSALSPYVIPDIILTIGGMSRSSSVIRIVGLAPYQHVPMVDLEAESNGYRFSPSNTFADENGQLDFLIYFNDIPASSPDQTYSATFDLGFNNCYISVHTDIANALVLDGPGTISSPAGAPNVGDTLDYTPGTATGGIPPISYAWVWKKQSDGSIVQVDGQTLTIPDTLANDRVFIELTATDSALASVTANTAGYPLSPDLIGRGGFPITNIAFPSSIPQEVSTLWADEGTGLSSSGCIEFKVGAGSFGQGPTTIANGGTITTRWVISPSCGGATNGTTISGCVFSNTYQECASLTLDRIPSPFSFVPVSAIAPGGVGTSQTIVPMGYNATAYVTYTGTSTASNIEASINGDPFVTVPIFGTNTLAINPGQTLTVRATTGSTPSSSYVANINIGEGSSVQSGSFTLNTSASSNFTTPIEFPTTTVSNSAAVTWLAGDGSTDLTSTGCIEFSVDSGVTFSQGPTHIDTGYTIITKWNSGGSCGGSPHGAVITGTVTNVPDGGTKTSYASLTLDRVPSSYSFSDLTNQSINTLVTSNVLTMVGFNATAYITYSAPVSGSSLTSVQAIINGTGGWVSIPSSGTTLSINPGDTLQIRGVTGGSTSTSYGVSINIGEGTSIQQTTWTASTTSVTPAIATPSIISPINGATGLTPYAVNPPGITISSSPYTPLNGASTTHQSTDWEIRSGSTSGTIVFNGNSTTQITSYFLDSSLISPATSYFVRCRYYSADIVPVVSNWSPWSQFNTATSFSLTWIRRYSAPSGSADNKTWYANAATWIGASTNKFVFVGQSGQKSRYSSDGITWTAGPVLSSGNDFTAVTPGYGTYANTLVAVGQNSSIRQSTNGGVSWTTPAGTLGGSNAYYTVVCNPSGVFVAGGSNGVIRTTSDLGVAWTSPSSTLLSDVQSITWDSVNSRFIAACSNFGDNTSPWTSNRLWTSPDGLTWNQITPFVVTNHTTSGTTTSGNFLFKMIRVVVIPGSPTRYFMFPTWADGPFSRYAVSTDLVNWDQYQVTISGNGQNIGNGTVGGNFIVTGWANYYSALANATPPYTFAKNLTSSNDYLRCVAYSPTLNRFVLGNVNGDITSTS